MTVLPFDDDPPPPTPVAKLAPFVFVEVFSVCGDYRLTSAPPPDEVKSNVLHLTRIDDVADTYLRNFDRRELHRITASAIAEWDDYVDLPTSPRDDFSSDPDDPMFEVSDLLSASNAMWGENK
jgi:hypothetical protein